MNSILNSLINNNFNNYLNNYINITSHEEVLDPLCCIIKLCILSFKPINTKISIKNNSIQYQEPNIIQSAIRWKNGDKRDHIHNLLNPINKFLLWYSLDDIKIKYIIELSKHGLSKLILCYNKLDSVILHSIQYYINIIDNALNQQSIINNISDSDIYFIKFKNLLSDSQISIIYNLILEICLLENNIQQNIFINSLEYIINEKEKIVHKIVSKIATTL